MAVLNGVKCSRLDGDFLPSQAKYERISRKFTAGVAFRHLGVKGEPYRVFYERYTSTFVGEREFLTGLVGVTVTATDERGAVHTNLRVNAVSNIQIKAAASMNGTQGDVVLSGAGYRVRAHLVMEHIG